MVAIERAPQYASEILVLSSLGKEMATGVLRATKNFRDLRLLKAAALFAI
jgi:hypothetical protein